MMVINQSRLDYQYRLSVNSPVILKTIYSNTVATHIVNDIIKVEKYADKTNVNVFDYITYTIKIYNIGNTNINNVFFQDSLPIETLYVANSLIIDGLAGIGLNPVTGFYIGTMSAGKMIEIIFKVLIAVKPLIAKISNFSNVFFDYVFNTGKPPAIISLKSNCISSIIDNSLFKQIHIFSRIKMSRHYSAIEHINSNISIVKTKILPAILNYHCTDSCNLIIFSTIEYRLKPDFKRKSNCCKKKKQCREIRHIEGFSAMIRVPAGIFSCNEKNIQFILENTSVVVIKNTILIDSEILLTVGNSFKKLT